MFQGQEFQQELLYASRGFWESLNVDDFEASADWLSLLEEFGCEQDQLSLAHSALTRSLIKSQMVEDTCEEHNVFCCPECFEMDVPAEVFESGDPLDDLLDPPQFQEDVETYFDREVAAFNRTLAAIHALPELSS